ncbi:MAG TPA: HD domain-containing phosphohydrolase [Bryobacteraceae bacterium]|nr:HD domain-containing phosphohydrolase [Bryobacteraceae bacterium]
MRYTKATKSYPERRSGCKPATAAIAERGGVPVVNQTFPAPTPEAMSQIIADSAVDPTESILFALAQAVEQRDRQTAGHCERLAFVSVAIGMAMGLERTQLLTLYRGGYLHDIGKVGIPDSILFKPGGLTAEEWITMRSHTTRGEDICRPLASLRPVLPIIRSHHERWDGGGYPDGLRGEQIPLLARIVQIADIHDALISPRPYKPALPAAEALRLLEEETSRGWRDPQIVDVFFKLHEKVLSKIAEYTTGADHNLDAMRRALMSINSII